MKRFLRWAPVLAGLLFLVLIASLERKRALNGQNDFVAFYTAAKLAGTPHLYSRQVNLDTVKSILGFNLETVVYIRPPFYAALLKPLSFFPYLTAYAIFSLLTLLSILFFVIRFAKQCPDLAVFASISIPFLSVVLNGQDTPFLLAFLGISMLLQKKGKDFSAGLVLSLCAIKFHLFLFLPILWVLKKKWRTLGGAVSGAAALFVIGIAIAGFASIGQYIALLRDPFINSTPANMPNLHGLASTLGGDIRLEVGFAAAVIFAFLWLCSKTEDYDLLFAAALVCGLLLSFHSGIADCVLLYPVFVLVLRVSQSIPLRVATALILSPVPFLTALAGAPYSSVLPLGLLTVLGLICLSALRPNTNKLLSPLPQSQY